MYNPLFSTTIGNGGKDSSTFLMESEMVKAGGAPVGHWQPMLKQNKRAPTEPKIGKGIPSQGNQPSWAIDYVIMYLLVGSVPGPKPILIWPSGCLKTTCIRLLFTTIFIPFLKRIRCKQDSATCFSHLTIYNEHSFWSLFLITEKLYAVWVYYLFHLFPYW